MRRVQLASGALILAVAACASGGDGRVDLAGLRGGPFSAPAGDPVTAEEAEAIAAEAVPGRVAQTEQMDERGLRVFEVSVQMEGGSVVAVDVAERSGQILQMECEDYHRGDDGVRLADGFVALSDALARALEAQPGEVVEWELELDEEARWIYEVEIRHAGGEVMEVVLDAVSGDVLQEPTPEAETETGTVAAEGSA